MLAPLRIPWPSRVWSGKVIYPPGGTLGPRIQPTLEIVLLYSGEMTVWIDGVRHVIAAGQMGILFPGHEERFTFAKTHESVHTYMHIELPSYPDPLIAALRILPCPLPLTTRMTEIVAAAIGLRDSTLPTAEQVTKTLALELLWQYIGEGERVRRGGHGRVLPAPIERARQYILAHLGEPFALNDLADAAAVSPSHLIRLFKATLDTTPMIYVWNLRVQRGIEMLEQTGLAVYIIAEQCGFQSYHHFCRRVRQATGKTPRDIRRRAWTISQTP